MIISEISRLHQWDTTGGTVWRENTRGKTEVVWTCKEDNGYIGIMILRLDLKEHRKRGRPKGRYTDAVREDMAVVEVTDADAENRAEWRWKIRCGDP